MNRVNWHIRHMTHRYIRSFINFTVVKDRSRDTTELLVTKLGQKIVRLIYQNYNRYYIQARK